MVKLRAKMRLIEAHDLLAPVYDWFTDGFDTAYLKDAKALLRTKTSVNKAIRT